jgi:hypothetical protein
VRGRGEGDFTTEDTEGTEEEGKRKKRGEKKEGRGKL